MIETYKYVHGYYDSRSPFVLIMLGLLGGHPFTLTDLKKELLQVNISSRILLGVVDTWKSLGKTVVETPTINSFNNR